MREEGELKLSIGENQIAFELNRTLLVSKLIEGNYPNYRQVIPSEAKERIRLERETFLTAVRMYWLREGICGPWPSNSWSRERGARPKSSEPKAAKNGVELGMPL